MATRYYRFTALCDGCRDRFRDDELTKLFAHAYFCAPCLPYAQDHFGRRCAMRRCKRMLYGPADAKRPETFFCVDHRLKVFLEDEIGRVRDNNLRAQALGKPGNLTVAGWLRTVKDFDGKCAYCQAVDFQVLEHYYNVEVAGTTEKTVVPACLSCNTRKMKGRRCSILPADMARVKRYLARKQHRRMVAQFVGLHTQVASC